MPALRAGTRERNGPQEEEGHQRAGHPRVPLGLLLPGGRGGREVDDPRCGRKRDEDEEGSGGPVEGLDGQIRGQNGPGAHRGVRRQGPPDPVEERPGAGDPVLDRRREHLEDRSEDTGGAGPETIERIERGCGASRAVRRSLPQDVEVGVGREDGRQDQHEAPGADMDVRVRELHDEQIGGLGRWPNGLRKKQGQEGHGAGVRVRRESALEA